MKYLNYIRYVCLLLVSLSASMPALTAVSAGNTCSNAIPVTDDFRDTISGQKTVWYSAWTFDLPLTVYFAPDDESSQKPEVEMDFTCVPGVYEDSILRSLFSPTEGSSGIDMRMPHKPTLQTKTIEGELFYYLSMGKSYRDLLLKVGIDYNVQVFVKVTYHSSGVISIAPDGLFANCMDGHTFLHLGDSISIAAQDKTTHFIVPYVQWQDDSIRYIWRGTHDVIAAVGYACSFDPTNNGDEVILDMPTLHAPVDTLKLTSEELKYYVNEADNEAGMFYAKFYSEGPGLIKVERVPQAPPKGGAILLEYGHSTQVDTTQLYAIPHTWTSATRFDVPSSYIFRMYVGATYDFSKQNALASWQFSRNDNGHWLGLLKTEMETLWTQAQEQYLYVRFECGEETTITPIVWTPSECIQNTVLIKKNSTFTVNAKSTTVYRIYFRDWEEGTMFAYWSQDALCKMLVREECVVGTNGSAVCYYEELEDRDTIPINPVDMAYCVDGDGFAYMRFYCANTGGQISLLSTAPDETDPEPLLYPKATIAIVCVGEPTEAGQEYAIHVSKTQHLTLDGDSWDQTPDSSHTVTLAPGEYFLQGETESMRIVVR